MNNFDVHQSSMSSSESVAFQAVNDTHVHPFVHPGQQQPQSEQNHHHHSLQISQHYFTDFGLNMDETLEGLMKKNIGSFDHLMESFSNSSSSLMDDQHPHHIPQQQQPTPSTQASAGHFSYFQDQQHASTPQQPFQQQQQRFQQQEEQQNQQGHMNFQDMSRVAWIPSHSANSDFSWSPSPQSQTSIPPQGMMQSINISTNDSSQEKLGSSLNSLGSQQILLQQQEQQHAKQQQQQQHRVSINHRYQQTFYIPQMQEDENEDDEDEVVESKYLPDHV
jgi:hypothetical protein